MSDGDDVTTVDRVDARKRLTGAEAVRAHITLTLGLALCVAAFWFELSRAIGGNSLSWAYVFEWPLLGIFAVYMWWKVIHPEIVNGTATSSDESKIAPEFNEMLAAWKAHQEELSQSRDDGSVTGNEP